MDETIRHYFRRTLHRAWWLQGIGLATIWLLAILVHKPVSDKRPWLALLIGAGALFMWGLWLSGFARCPRCRKLLGHPTTMWIAYSCAWAPKRCLRCGINYDAPMEKSPT